MCAAQLETADSASYPRWQTIGELVRERARGRPDRVSVTIAGEALTYRQLDERTDRIAAQLHAGGIGRGDRVCCFMYNCVEQLLVWIATVKLGAVWVPLNASLAGNDLRYTLTDAQPRMIVVDDENEPKLADFADIGIRVKVGALAAGYLPFAALLAPAPLPDWPEIAGFDPAVIIYTGGTTGMPKGVVLPHLAWIAAGARYCEAVTVRPNDVHFSILSMFHVGGLMAGLIGPIAADIPTVMEKWFSARSFWDSARAADATIIDPIGTMLAVLVKAPPSPAERTHRVRVCLGAFGQLDHGTIASFAMRFGFDFVNLYSLTEGGGLMIVNNPLGSPKPYSNGRASPWVDIQVVDDEGFPVRPGEQGEICLRPRKPFIFMLGYHNNPQRTVDVFNNLWLHTGDIGYLDEEGYLYFTGRQAHFLRRRGENVSVHEVEAVIREHPGVSEVAVVGVASELGDDDIKAFIIPSGEPAIDPATLFQWCRERMTYFKVPRYIEMVPDFPRSAAKREVERHKLKARLHAAAWDSEAIFGRPSRRGTQGG